LAFKSDTPDTGLQYRTSNTNTILLLLPSLTLRRLRPAASIARERSSFRKIINHLCKRDRNRKMSLKSPYPPSDAPPDITNFPRELNLNILTFLRATDLSALQRTSRVFNNRDLIVAVVDHCANVVVSCVVNTIF
jgi:hypothetical protein